ncbi:Ig-like domain-containing protein [Mariniblastus fucicola]|uniref:G8 domain protein n=1 Tax=Mariniblastus fucicola TaxID=980251 RepID=A0A5B9P3Y3_9BACT|nr:Ig-like domain-containing protein [Mariniblastus fucicola]QEG20924.1 G8 domain protein [Mariniblastus fucicola]
MRKRRLSSNLSRSGKLSYATLESRQLLAGVSHAISSGPWHAATTWDNGVPDTATRAVIDSGVTVNLAGVDHVAEELVIQGNLVVDEGATAKTLTTRWIHVNSGGVFQIGTEADRYNTNDFVITLTGEDPTDSFDIEGVADPITDNDAFLMAAGGGRLQFFGEDKLSFTKLKSTANVGDNQIVVEKEIDRDFDGDIDAADGEVNWTVGDQIVVASSTGEYADEEVRTISNIVCLTNGDVVITLDQALNHRHYGAIETYSNDSRSWDIDMRAEVALLSRNVRIQGLASQDTDNFFGDRARYEAGSGDGFGAHTMIMGSAGQITVDNVQLDRMGQTSRLGRYPIHWHLAGDRSGDVLRNASITNSNNRGVTIHGTHNLHIEGVVLHDIHGHGFFMEDAVETGNVFQSNITFGIHKVGRTGNAVDLDDPFIVDTHDHVGQNAERFLSSAGYWMTSPDNTWVGNVSAGSEGTGFWFVFPRHAVGESANDPQYDNVVPNEVDLGQFDYNSSHSSPIGLNFDRGTDIEGPIGDTLKDNFDGLEHRPDNEPQINFYTAYKHDTGIYHRGRIGNFHENRLADVGRGTFITFTQRITDTLYVGHSQGNSDSSEGVAGHTFYDGANTLDGTHFAGFNGSNANMFIAHGAAQRLTHFVMSNTTFEDDGSADNVRFVSPSGGTNYSPVGKTMPSVIYDADGSFTGHVGGGAGSTIVPNHPFFYDADDFQPTGWEARVSDDLYAMFRMRAPDSGNPVFRVTSPGGESGTAQPGTGQFSGTNTLMKLDGGGDYVLDFPDGPSAVASGFDVTFYAKVGPSAGSTIVRFKDVASSLLPQDIPRVNGGLTNLRAATQTSFEVVDGDVWMKLFSSADKIYFEPEANSAPVALDDSIVTNEDVAVSISVVDNDSDSDGDTIYVNASPLVVADYVDDFQSPTAPANWQYLWNQNSQLGDESGYVDMSWSNWRYHPVDITNFPYLGPTFAHPGDGTSEGIGVERFAIAAFTIPVDGNYSIANSSITPNENTVNGVNVAAHISGQSVMSLGQFDESDVGSSFDAELGFANAGDVIYVALGANASKGADGTSWDFSIIRDGSPENGQLTVNADGTITYTPNPDFHGTDSFAYEASDGRGGFDIATVTVTVNSVPDIAAPVVVGNATASRSIVSQLVVGFDEIVTLQPGAFTVTNVDLMQQATVSAAIDNSSGSSVVTLTFSGAVTESATGSLVDGNYQLAIDGSKVEGASGQFYDGDGDGIAGGMYLFGNDPGHNFFRLYGDVTGDRTVSVFDLLQFRQTYLTSVGDPAFNEQFDVTNDGLVNVFDLLRFRQNYRKDV